jgi:hypothetical protein
MWILQYSSKNATWNHLICNSANTWVKDKYSFNSHPPYVCMMWCLCTHQAIGVRSPGGANDFSSSLCVQAGSGAHPAACPMGTGDPFPGGKARQGRDTDHSPPSSARGQEWVGAIRPLPPPQAPSWRVAGLLYFTLLMHPSSFNTTCSVFTVK